MPTQKTKVNGFRVDHSDLEVAITRTDGQGTTPPPLRGITSLDWAAKRQGKNKYGTGSSPLGQTHGIVDPSASFEIYKEEWKIWLLYLGDGYIGRWVKLAGTYTPKVNGDTFSVEITGSIMEVNQSTKQGDGPTVKVTVLPVDIVDDGVKLLEES